MCPARSSLIFHDRVSDYHSEDRTGEKREDQEKLELSLEYNFRILFLFYNLTIHQHFKNMYV